MIYLFGPTGQKSLEQFCKHAALYAFDFDGTLAPMDAIPDNAGMRPATERLWAELRERVKVAIITGRSRKDAATKFTQQPHYLIGNHGLEGVSQDRSKQLKAKETVREWNKPLNERLKKLGGVEIENKVYSVSVHYRQARHHGRAKSAILEMGSRLSPVPRMIPGKCVVNLVPPGSPNKGTSLLDVMKAMRVKHALFVGDDHTDEDAFHLKHPGLFTICVGKRAESGAKYFMKSQSEIDRLLRLLVTFHGKVSSK